MTVYPFFIPHHGCRQRCVFCQQQRISGVAAAPSPAQVARRLAAMLPDSGGGEVAFYGGSFTLIEDSLQGDYLASVAPFLRSGRVAGIRVSTRPDACDSKVLERLKAAGVTTVELGCQSFCDEVLRQAQRGHEARAAVGAVARLRNKSFRIGLQLMPGLPGGSADEARLSLAWALALAPDFLRLYPTVVLAGTALERAWRLGRYLPLTLEEAVALCAELLWHCRQAGVPVIRLGLQSSGELDGGSAVIDGPYHPAFGQLVRSRLWRRALQAAAEASGGRRVEVCAADLSDAFGHRRSNVDHLRQRFGVFDIVAAKEVGRESFVIAGRCYDLQSQARYLQPLPTPSVCPPVQSAFSGSTHTIEE